MESIYKITLFIDKWLKIAEIEDASNNGLQVEGNKQVNKIGFAVDACMDVFEKAKEQNCDLVIVHHGLSWKDSLRYITDSNAERIKFLMKNDISLYGVHLPLDKHNELGNNIQLCKLFNVSNVKEFGEYHGDFIGFKGEFESEKILGDFVKEVEEKLDTKCKVLDFGRSNLKTIAIVSGGAPDLIPEAAKKGVDVFLTGEGKLSAYHFAKEGNLNVIFAGHYATETLGVIALAKVIKEKFDVETVFIENKVDF
jgi:dinuclear metal center YbgI/SA1388 family protein